MCYHILTSTNTCQALLYTKKPPSQTNHQQTSKFPTAIAQVPGNLSENTHVSMYPQSEKTITPPIN
jgi:hypothetical protein